MPRLYLCQALNMPKEQNAGFGKAENAALIQTHCFPASEFRV